MFQELPVNVPNVLALKASGRLTDADYQSLIPRLEALIQEHGRISLLVELEDFEGWDAKAAWDDLDFGLKHDRDFERIAIVGDNFWQHWITAFSNLFTHSLLRFFPRDEQPRAWEWLNETARDARPIAYRHILLATDFSADARYAARRAAEIATRYGARIDLIHVVDDLALHDEFYDPVVPYRDKRLGHDIERAQAMLDDLSKTLGTDEEIEVRCEVVVGSPKSAIPNYARRHGVDLIVVGSHGKGRMRHLLGSVADAVSHSATCDVLTIHP